jgi:hypothetical protein
MISYRQSDLLRSFDKENSVVFETTIWPLNQKGMLGLTPLAQGLTNSADPKKYDYASSIHGIVSHEFNKYLLEVYGARNFILRQPEDMTLEDFVLNQFVPGIYEYIDECIGGDYSKSGDNGIRIHLRMLMPS